VTAERYIAVFTGLLSIKKPGEYLYLTMSEDPLGAGGGYALHRGRPPYERLEREIRFEDLPQGCRNLVLYTYEEQWSL
jgi:hypothetical protein